MPRAKPPTNTFASVRAQIAILEKEAENLRKGELSKVIASIKSHMETYSLSPADLGWEPGSPVVVQSAAAPMRQAVPTAPMRPAVSASKAVTAPSKAVTATSKAVTAPSKAVTAPSKTTKPPKYVDPKTGVTWNGHGQAPSWIKDAKNRDVFLISAKVDSTKAASANPAGAELASQPLPLTKVTAPVSAAGKTGQSRLHVAKVAQKTSPFNSTKPKVTSNGPIAKPAPLAAAPTQASADKAAVTKTLAGLNGAVAKAATAKSVVAKSVTSKPLISKPASAKPVLSKPADTKEAGSTINAGKPVAAKTVVPAASKVPALL